MVIDLYNLLYLVTELVNMFLAGFIFVVLFDWLTNIKQELYLVGIWSLFANAFIKSVFSIVHKFYLVEINFDEHLKILIYVISSVMLAFILARVYNGKILKRILIKVGKKTLGNNVFKDVIDFDMRTIMSVYLKDSDYFYIGTFKYMDEHEGDSYISLVDYFVCNRADNSLLRNSCSNKMSIVFCLRDVEHIELLYEDNSDVWKLLGDGNTKDNKENEMVGNKSCLIIRKVVNLVGIAIRIIALCVFIGTLVYMMFYQYMLEVANAIDFIIAMMAVGVLIISYVRNKMDERKQYLWVSTTYILLFTLGLLIFMLVAIKIKNASGIARVLSCVCLGITIIQEIICISKIEYKIDVEKEYTQKEKLKRTESESSI